MLFRLLIFAVLGFVIYRVFKSLSGGAHLGNERTAAQPPEHVDDEMIKDPVCGAYFPKRTAVVLAKDNRNLHFCSTVCRDRYVEQRSNHQSH